ncbi:MAG: large repetitive protein, partial [Acidobacteriota bacterium]
MRDSTDERRTHLRRRNRVYMRTAALLALGVAAVFAASASQAMPFFGKHPLRSLAAGGGITAKQHEGQRSNGTYTSGNITEYKEGDTINFRFTLSSSDAGTGQMQVRFTGDDGNCLFFDPYFVLGSVDNVSGSSPTVAVADGPTQDSFGTSNGEWVVTLNVAFPAAGEAIANYQLKLSQQAGDCTGS